MMYRRSLLFIALLHLLSRNCVSTDDANPESENTEQDEEATITDHDDTADETLTTVPQIPISSDPPKDPIHYLNDLTFPPFIEQHSLVLVEFVKLEGCDRCRMYLKSYQKAAEILQYEDPPIPLVRINSERNPKLVKKYQIAKYPTLLVFKNAKHYLHHGQRGYNDLVNYMLERAQPDWKPTEGPKVIILSRSNMTEYLKDKPLVLVKFYSPNCPVCQKFNLGEEEAANYIEEHLRPQVPYTKVDISADRQLAQMYNVTEIPTFKIFRKGVPFPYKSKKTDAISIVAHMKEQTDMASTRRNSREQIQEHSNKLESTIVGFFSNEKIFKKQKLRTQISSCPVCQKFNLGEEEAANYIEEHLRPQVPYTKVDISADRQLAQMYNVTEIPTFKIFRKGVPFPYKSKKTDAISIVAHMKEQTDMASTRRNSREQIQEHSNKLESTIVGFFSNEKSEYFTMFQDAINHFRELVPLMHSFDKETMKHYDITPDTVLVFPPKFFHSKRWEPDFHEFKMDNQTQDELLEFLWDSIASVVGFRGRDNADYLYTFRPLLVVYFELDFTAEQKETTDLIRDEVRHASEQVLGVQFCISHELEFEDELVEMGLEDYMGSVSAVYIDEKNIKHPRGFNDNFMGLHLKIMALQCLAGKCEARLKSQPIPASNSEPMKVIVANSFDKQVNKTEKNLVLALYSLDCLRSETYMPTVETLAKMFKDEKDLIVARMNVDANDIPLPFKKDILPTIYFVRSSNKETPILYEHVDVNLDSLVSFVKKHLAEERELKMKVEL